MEGEIIPGSRAHGHGTDGSRFDAATRRRRDGLSENESMRVAGTGGGPVEEMDWGEGTIPIDGRRFFGLVSTFVVLFVGLPIVYFLGGVVYPIK